MHSALTICIATEVLDSPAGILLSEQSKIKLKWIGHIYLWGEYINDYGTFEVLGVT